MNNVTKRIKEFNKGRLPAKVQLKYAFMAENMFRFYRGTCHLFYEDIQQVKSFPSSPLSWVCGDLHLENFGSYKGDNRLVYFDLNDFDEACLAPANYEIVRAVTSIFVAFSALKINHNESLAMAKLYLGVYSGQLKKGKAYYIETETAKGIVQSFLEAANERKQKQLISRLTILRKGRRLLMIDNSHFYKIEKKLKAAVIKHIKKWLAKSLVGYEVEDAAFRVSGTGSVGQKRYVFLLKNKKQPEKYRLLEMKQALQSSLQPFLKAKQPAWKTQAERIVMVQERMQNVSAALLDTTIFADDEFIMQEMQPVKDSIDFTLIKSRPRDIGEVIGDMAMLTASAQLRSSGRQGSAIADELIAFGKDDKWQAMLLAYSIHYAEQVKKDYTAFCKDYKKGLLAR